ncbi:PHD finger protein 23A-like isoform X1 [Dendronephthya gigantea]|uniref:PHD finger protein 23A-like isoform X1 n=2 Tax=Dendronephthya gigantea TaxID=151771 RepID=UPI001069D1D2|nr:PHD finger protein 23A-like isoform X1 [Dendronephthya gigantea]
MNDGSLRVAPRRFSDDGMNSMPAPEPKKLRKSLEEFNSFCSYVLAYEARLQEVERRRRQSPKSSGEESTSSSTDSAYSESISSPDSSDERLLDNVDEEYDSGDESWNKVTCFCEKPFAGRPMIECSECLVWIHLSCAKIRKSNVPEVFVCQKCRDARHTMRRSQRVKTTPSPKRM